MDFVERMNRALAYIEEHLSEEINLAEAAKAACLPPHHFQRMFPVLTDVSLSEYIRRRRLTLAAFELQNSPVKVIEVALKYGYESPEAFARAFQQVHGTTPTAARSAGTKLKAYPRISFQIRIKGVAEMNYRMEERGGFAVVGLAERVREDEAFSAVPELWAKEMRAGLFEKLWELRSEHPEIPGILGVCADGEWGKAEEFLYILSIESAKEPPNRMVRREFPAATWAVFEAEGGPEGISALWKRLYAEWLPVSAYELANLPAIECYLPPEENRNELWIPVVKKK